MDKRIINELIRDARLPFVQIADKLKISNSMVHQRVKKLRELLILGSPTYRIEPEPLGYETCAFTQIKLEDSKAMYSVVDALEGIPEVVECANIAGRFAIMIKIYAKNNAHLRDVIYEKIQSIAGVEETNTVVAFETNFLRNVAV
ncbi:MAG: Lrp/AsnC ligand binding domain-containing protein [Saprospiraceae bacterium]|nr:Lrp/AsnC ligand binding domain-containing protein [Saprospiraceae bacterium]